jgi:hypothetical protein
MLTKNEGSQPMLWGHAIAFWDTWGFRLMIAGAALGGLALFVSLASSVILYAVSEAQQAQFAGDVQASRERTAALEKEAADARLEQDRLKARLAPRLLTQAQQNEITAKLSEAEKQYVTIVASPSTPESEWFARILGAPLSAAGWKVEGLPGTPTATVLFPKGVVISYGVELARALNPDDPRAKAATALAEALKDIGIDATAIPGRIAAPRTMSITISERW